MDHPKPPVIPAALVFEVRRHLGIGIGVIGIKRFLEACELEFYSRFMEAIRTQSPEPGHHFYDPIEDDPEFGATIEEADRETEETLRDRETANLGFCRTIGLNPRGSCHLFWWTKQQILREKYQIQWFMPSQMSPWTIFD